MSLIGRRRTLHQRFMIVIGLGVTLLSALVIVLIFRHEEGAMERKLHDLSANEISSLNALIANAMDGRRHDTQNVGIAIFNGWFDSRNKDYPGKLWSAWSPKTTEYMARHAPDHPPKPVRDAIDREVMDSGRPAMRIENGFYRYSVPIIQGVTEETKAPSCRICHQAMGIGDGDVIAVLSSSLSIEPERQDLKSIVLILLLGGLAAAIAAGAGVRWLLTAMISAPTERVVALMGRLAAGETDMAVPFQDREDEIGDMARAVQVFKDNAVETEGLRRAQVETLISLQESEDRFRSLVEGTTDWVWETDVKHRFSWISASVEQVLGMPCAEILGKHRWDLASKDCDVDIDLWQSYLATLGEQRSFRDFRYWIHIGDGQSKWISVSGSPRYDDNGAFLGYRGSGSDITPEAAAAMRLKMLSTAVEQSPVSVVITDPDGTIEYVNSHFTVATGFERVEAIGNNSRILSSGETPAEVYRELWATIAAGQRWAGQLLNRRKDGALRWEDVVIAPVLNDEDQVAHYVAIKEDVTERRALQDKLRQTNAELEQFAYVASHDLRQPLRMVSSYLTLIERHFGAEIDADVKEFIGFAVGGAKRMDRLILDLLEYSRTGRQTELEPVSLAQSVADALDNLSVAIEESSAEIVVADGLPEVAGDPMELIRLFQNLIGNAVKYRAPERTPKVAIGWQRQGRDWVISVADNGIGIAPEDRERAFRIFQRLVPKEAYDGTGIGLAVCKKIVEHHGGRIWIESELGAGSTFFVTFPAG